MIIHRIHVGQYGQWDGVPSLGAGAVVLQWLCPPKSSTSTSFSPRVRHCLLLPVRVFSPPLRPPPAVGQNESCFRQDFLLKYKNRTEQDEIETRENLNRLLLENVLPAHVATLFVGENKKNEVVAAKLLKLSDVSFTFSHLHKALLPDKSLQRTREWNLFETRWNNACAEARNEKRFFLSRHPQKMNPSF